MPRKSQFTEEQIIKALKEVEAGAKATEVCRRLGVTEQTFYRWKAKFGGMDVSDAKRLKALEEENHKLKLLVAEQLLDVQMLRFALSKNELAGGEATCRRRGPSRVREEPAPMLSGAGLRAFERVVPQPSTRTAEAPQAAQGAGGETTAVRIPTAASDAWQGWLRGEPQARAPALSHRRPRAAQETAQAHRKRSEARPRGAHARQRALVDGLRLGCHRERPSLPHFQRRRRVHA